MTSIVREIYSVLTGQNDHHNLADLVDFDYETADEATDHYSEEEKKFVSPQAKKVLSQEKSPSQFCSSAKQMS